MVKAHRAVVERFGPGPVHGVLLDTPFGFQVNADDLSARAVADFEESVGAKLEVAGLRSAADLQGPPGDALLARLAAASFVFAGPGSPTYALRQWRDTLVPSLLAEKLSHGGAVTFASAAALTLGVSTVPVYEIYKVGEEPRWEEGLDLLSAFGLPVAVIPHFDNAEGGTHDTRFCYLGEQRLALLEQSLPTGAFVLGVDEHTALFLDFEAGTASVQGRGVVTVRAAGHVRRISAGEELPIGQLSAIADELARAPGAASAPPAAASATSEAGAEAGETAGSPPVVARSPLLEAVRAQEERFRAARRAGDADAMVAAVLALEEELWSWRADTLQSDENDRARAALRAMVGELGQVARSGTRHPAELVGPYVELALAQRDAARGDRRFAEADAIRDRLVDLGVEVHDGPDGTSWQLQPQRDGEGA
jgi:hypothetical protein